MKAEDVPEAWVDAAAAAGFPEFQYTATCDINADDMWRAAIAAVAPLIAAAEREACAKLVETHAYANGAEGPYLRPSEHAEHDIHHRTIAAAIRSRTGDK